MLVILATALATVAATVSIHALGTAWWLQWLRMRYQAPHPRVIKQARVLSVLIQTALVLIALHVVEVFLWAVMFRLLPHDGLASFEEALYFSFTTFTTLGYGDITLSGPGRLLTGIESLNGVLLIGWSTALSFAVIQRIWVIEER